MAAIVGVHGIAQQFRGGYELGRVWYDAIRDGLVAADYESVANALAPTDVVVSFFGDLFRQPGSMAGAGPAFAAADIEAGLERDLLSLLYEAAVAQDPSLGVPGGAMPGGRAAVQVMLDRLARSKTFARVAQRTFIGNLKQVTAFLTSPAIKQQVLARARDQISKDTRVIIGHSLGSVVAYEYLCCDQPSSVELLVTLGSPLGIPNMVFHRLTPSPAGGIGAWPGPVAAWTNVADPDDFVALRKDLASLFRCSGPVREVADRLVDNGDEPHAVDRYLNTRQTGRALGDVLSK